MYVCMSFSPCPNAHNDDWQSEGFRELLDVNGVVSRREYSTPADDESLKAIHLVVRVFSSHDRQGFRWQGGVLPRSASKRPRLVVSNAQETTTHGKLRFVRSFARRAVSAGDV